MAAPDSPPPEDLLTLVPEEAVRRIALERLDELEKASGRLADPEDAEAVHDLRVALRRLRSTLGAWKPYLAGSVRARHRRKLKELQSLTGAGRDAEVGARWVADLSGSLTHGEGRGAAWLRSRLAKRALRERKGMLAAVKETLPKLLRRLRRGLSTYAVYVGKDPAAQPSRFGPDLAQALRRHGEQLLRSLAGLKGGEDTSAAHAARIEGKRLRYLMEPVAERLPEVEALLTRLKGLQDELGAIQDFVVLESLVGTALEDAAVAHARKLRKAAERGGRRAGAAPRAPRDATRAGLLALARQVADTRRTRLEAVREGWRQGAAPEALAAAVEAVAHSAEARAHAGLEIERKYLLRALPPLHAGELQRIEQGWLPGEQLQERLRRVVVGEEVRCWRTVKLGRGVSRIEVEEACPLELFERLWPLTEGCRVTKRRHVVREGAHAFEVDEFLDRDLVLAEVELASADETVALPDWLAPFVVREVTGEDEFVNRNLAR